MTSPEQKRAAFAAWQAAHRAERSAYERRRLAAKPELARAARLRRREKRAAEYRAWCARNPDRVRFLNARRRARKAAAPGSHTWQEWAEKKHLFAYCCAYCGESGPLTVDHKIPLSRGGSDSIDNILPACFTCYAQKHDKTTAEFLISKEVAA